MYCFSFNLFITSFLLVILKEIHSIPDLHIERGDWDITNKGWPIKDQDDVTPHQFYFNKGFNLNTHTIKLNQTLIANLKNKIILPMKLRFKYYQYNDQQNNDKAREFRSYIFAKHDVAEQVDAIHESKYRNNWMPREYTIPEDNLELFKMTMSSNDTLIALKDLEIEYTSYEDKPTNRVLKPLEFGGWKKYSIPPKVQANEIVDFIYFPDCSSKCKMIMNMTSFEGYENNNLTEISISLKHWTNGKAFLNVFNEHEEPIESRTWTKFERTFNKTQIYKTNPDKIFSIEITAPKEVSVALKEVHIEYKFMSNEVLKQHPGENCMPDSCNWRAIGKYFWSKSNDKLFPNSLKDEDKYLFFPINETNLLDIGNTLPYLNKDSCIKFEYWAGDQKFVQLNLIYSSWNDELSDTILSIKPRVDETKMQTSFICLKDLIAVDKKDFTLSFNVEQSRFDDSINGFALRILEHENNTKTREKQYFLHAWDGSLPDIKSEWDTFIPNLEPFTFAKSVTFKAVAESKMRASAQLMSKWLVYDDLLLEDLQFNIVAPELEMFNYFNITPKICDSMMFCREGVKTDDSTESRNKYTFSNAKISDFIKLAFFIEYSIPIRENTIKSKMINFELELIHFGDPCFENKCGLFSECASDSSVALPHNRRDACDCPTAYTGDNCDIKNKCYDPTIREQCKAEGGCQPLDGSYKCNCTKGNNIIWDTLTTKCVLPKTILIPTDPAWIEQTDPTGTYYELKKDSDEALTIEFKGIDEQYDVCLTLDYESPKIITLNMKYTDIRKTPAKDLINFEITGIDSLYICVGNFIKPSYHSFNILLSVKGEGNDWYKGFKLIYKTNIEKLVSNQPFLKNWKQPNTILHEYIKSSMPNSFYKLSLSDFSEFGLKLTVPEKSKNRKIWIFSEWVDYDIKYIDKFFHVSYEIQVGTETNFNLNPKICYLEENFICIESRPEMDKDTKDTSTNKQEFFKKFENLKNTNKPVKVLLEITINVDTPFDIKITSLEFHDPCFEKNCHYGKCVYKGINQKEGICECDVVNGYGGIDCTEKNSCEISNDKNVKGKVICQDQPNFEDKESTCQHVSIGKLSCECPSNYYFWNSDLLKCVRNPMKKEISKCENQNCNIFNDDPMTKLFSWSHKNFPTFELVGEQKSSFHYSTKSESELKIRVSNIEDKNDFCFEFKYFATKTAQLFIKYNNNVILELPASYESSESRIDWSPKGEILEKICIKDFVIKPDSTFNISFRGKFSDEDTVSVQMDVKDMKFVERKSPLSLPYLIQNDFQNKAGKIHDFDNQTTIRFPHDLWIRNGLDKIQFQDYLPKESKIAFIMSNWIDKWVDGMELRFKIDSKNGEFEYFSVQVVVYDTNMSEKIRSNTYTNTKIRGSNKGFISYPIQKLEGLFRVAIRVTYKMNDRMGYSSQKNPLFTLGPMSLGDACIKDDSLIYRDCFKKSVEGCIRLGPSDYTCNCIKEWNTTKSKDCEFQNFCNSEHGIKTIMGENKIDTFYKTGAKFCQEHNDSVCINEPSGNLSFACVCKDDNKYWNYALQECSFWPKCAEKTCDYLTQKCVEPKDPKGDPTCGCREGFIENNKTNTCEKEDICKHHNPCPDPKMRCFSIANEKDGHICQCPNGFKNKENKCESNMCAYPPLHNCVQKCTNTQDAYQCECYEGYDKKGDNSCVFKNGPCDCKNGEICDVNKRCYCPPDHEVKDGNCQLKSSDSDFEDFCPNEQITIENGKLSCNCSGFYQKNSNQTCTLKHVCSKDDRGRKECEEKSAKCKMDISEIGKYDCQCPKGKIFPDGSITMNSDNKNTSCIDICDLSGKEVACGIRNAKCNPVRLQLLISDSNPTHNLLTMEPDNYCDCLPGYYLEKGRGCVLAKYSAKFTLIIKNNNFYPNDLIVSPELPDFYRSQPHLGARLKRQAPSSSKDIHKIDLIGYYEAIVEQEKLNELLEISAQRIMTKYNFKDFVQSKAYDVIRMRLTDKAIPSKDRVAIEKCSLFKDSEDFYQCDIVVVLDKHFNEIKTELDAIVKTDCKDITHIKRKDLCFFLYNDLIVNKEKSFSPTNNQPCESDHNCPMLSNCIKSKDDTNYYSCECGEHFNIKKKGFMQTQDLHTFYRKDQCEAKNLCESCRPEDNRICFQEAPKFNTSVKKYQIDRHCNCKENFHEKEGITFCTDVCHNNELCVHGNCEKSGRDGFTCVCNDGWSGKQCDKEGSSSSSSSNGGWIAGIVILGVLVVLVAAVAVFFARKARNSTGSSPSHQMDDYSGAPSRRFGEQNPTFHRD